MGLKYAIKKAIIKGSMDKKKKEPFDIDVADRFVLPTSADETFNDSHYFSVHDISGKMSLFYRLAERGGSADTEIWMVYRSADGEVYMAEKDHIKKGVPMPAKVECIEPGKLMRFTYSGKVKKAVLGKDGYVPGDGATLDLELDAVFTGSTKPFEFSKHMSSESMAASIAKNKFTKEFRADVKEMHQVHYEQGGTVSGKLALDGKTVELTNITALRDHSYGKRVWGFFNRYVWILSLLENGDFFQTSMIRYPNIRELQAGFYISGDKTVCTSFITSMDDIPVTGSAPKEYTYFAEYENGEKKKIECKLDFNCPLKFENGTFTVNEGVSDITVNGIKGRGITEFGFSNDPQRWK